jgi:hypothetical protein
MAHATPPAEGAQLGLLREHAYQPYEPTMGELRNRDETQALP